MGNFSSIDIIILDKNENILLIKREHEPFSNMFSLVGGIQQKFESFDSAIERILKQKLGFISTISNLQIIHSSGKQFTLQQLKTYDSGSDNRGGNTTSFVLETNLDKKELLSLTQSKNIEFKSKNNLPELAFDHQKFISDYFFSEKNYTTRIEQNLSVTIDVVLLTIQNSFLKVLLSKRSKEPFKDLYTLPGGFIDNSLSLEENAKSLLQRDTNFKNIFLEQLYTFGEVKRDPRGRVISITYYALIDSSKQNLISSKKYASSEWINCESISKLKLAFDHKKIIEMTLDRLFNKIEYTNVAFQLLPEKFTLGELQEVYETILKKNLDKRNFRKKILEHDILEELEEFKQQGRMRPARYHRFKERTKETPLKAKRWI